MQPIAKRNTAVDAYRGFVMFLMLAEALELAQVSKGSPGNWLLSFLAYNQTHVDWAGCSLHDMIQPSFSFLVGVALPYSIASRISKGQSTIAMFGHALWRGFLLAALGIFLRSTHSPMTNFTFEDTLTQIGLGYPFLFLLGLRSPRSQWTAFGVILFGYWLAWMLYPAPSFEAHWFKNANLGSAFDQWFLNLFPRPQRFIENRGGYLTLSFIPTLGTMLLGLVAGRWMKDSPAIPLRRFWLTGFVSVVLGLALHFTGVSPIVKRIWTPAWVLFSGGLCFWFLAAFCWAVEVKGWRKAVFPLVVIGMNSIAAYCMDHLIYRWIVDTYRIHLGKDFFAFAGKVWEPFFLGCAILAFYWLVLWWMYRRKLFLRV